MSGEVRAVGPRGRPAGRAEQTSSILQTSLRIAAGRPVILSDYADIDGCSLALCLLLTLHLGGRGQRSDFGRGCSDQKWKTPFTCCSCLPAAAKSYKQHRWENVKLSSGHHLPHARAHGKQWTFCSGRYLQKAFSLG